MSTLFTNLKLVLTVLFLSACFAGGAYAQTTGSIGGTVTDDAGIPLPGATIKIEGRNQGAVTNDQGDYIILNVDVGTYNVTASYIGFQTQRVTNVKVSVDQRATASFRLTVEGITTDVIDVEAVRSGIEVEQSGRVVTQEQIENSGIRGINNIVSKTAGVVQDERGGQVNIRGGRESENQVIVDGVATTNPLSGLSTAQVPNSLLQEISVLTGGFGAEYGNALSGIINVTTRGGSEVYTGSLEGITDAFTGDWIGTTSQGYNLYNASIGGPLIPTKSLAKVINFYGGLERQFLLVRDPSWIADRLFDNGIIPNNKQKLWSYNGRLTVNLNEIKGSKVPIQFRAGALVTNNEYQEFLQSYFKNNSEHNRLHKEDNTTFYGRITHNVTNNFFYELQGNYFQAKNEAGDGVFFDNWAAYGDTIANPYLATLNGGPGQGRNQSVDPTGVFYGKGRVSNRYDYSDVSYFGGKLDATLALITKRLGNHEVKFGGEYRYHTLKTLSFQPIQLASYQFTTPEALRSAFYSTNFNLGLLGAYGVPLNLFGVDIIDPNSDDYNARHPIVGAFYIRDKVDLDDFTFNLGLRIDYLDVNDDVLIDPSNVRLRPFGQPLSNEFYKKSEANIVVSPRLGFSFPITTRTTFFANYGKFIQQPPLQYLYIGKVALNAALNTSQGAIATVNNPSLEPEKLTSYEIGFKQQAGDFVNFGISAYYKETRDQIGLFRITANGETPPYALYANTDFSISRGLDVYLSVRRINRLAVDLSYTLLYASGVGSDPDSKSNLLLNTDIGFPKFLSPTDYDQRHTGSINLDYRFGSKDVPKGWAGEVLKNFGINLLFQFNSGRPYTPRTAPKSGAVNGAVTDGEFALTSKNAIYRNWNTRMDMKIDKSVDVWKTKLNFYIYALNLFNTEVVNEVYGSTGRPDDAGFLNTPTGVQQTAGYKADYIALGSQITNWGIPRQIRFGIRLDF